MKTQELPFIPLRDIVIFPNIVLPLFVGRKMSIEAINQSLELYKTENILLVAQKNSDEETPREKDLYTIGVKAKIAQVIKLTNEKVKLLVEAEKLVKVTRFIDIQNQYIAQYKHIEENNGQDDILLAEIIKAFTDYSQINRKVSPSVLKSIIDKTDLKYTVNIIATHISGDVKQKQEILESTDIQKRGIALLELIKRDTVSLETATALQSKVKKQIEKTQRDYYLNEQMKVIQKELSEGDDKSEAKVLERKIKTLKLSKEAREKAESEMNKYKMMNSMSSEAAIVRNYLDILLSMPWKKLAPSNIDIKSAQKILDKDHYSLDKVKERVIEYLSVLKRTKKTKSPILCFVGPPGVGKTSLVKSIADAIGRPYAKFSLGGVRDEAEIRGHRRTYIGSIPGKIISLLRKTKKDNPVMLLDEIDKMASDFRGDPASALLETLDPEQNEKFVDHYLEVEYDLSNVLFIATANSLDIPLPLLDRMEIIRVSGYLEEEKASIAINHLIPKQIGYNGLKKTEITFEKEAILHIVRYYTRESGVRSLEREIAAICRKSLKKILSEPDVLKVNVTTNVVEELLGPKKYRVNFAEEEDCIGMTTGLAYTQVGGELLNIEAVLVPGKGEIKTTGKLGEVMQESAKAAYSFFQASAAKLKVKHEDYKNLDIHLHVPEGATPKDGPSAGVAIFTTIVSAITKRPVSKKVAMTGEITLRGRVLAIGGLKEKLLAAKRGGITTVMIPEDNESDLQEIPKELKEGMNIIPIGDANRALDIALVS